MSLNTEVVDKLSDLYHDRQLCDYQHYEILMTLIMRCLS